MKIFYFFLRKLHVVGFACFLLFVNVSYAAIQQQSKQQFNNAKQLFKDKNYTQALEAFKRLRGDDVKNKELVTLYEALCLKNLRNEEEAIELLQGSGVLNSGSVENEQAFYILAECYSNLNRRDDLAKIAKTLKMKFPDSSWNVNMDLLTVKGDNLEFKSRLERENQAQREVASISRSWLNKTTDTTQTCEKLDVIIKENHDLPVGLRAQLSKANILSYGKETSLEAIESFESLLAKLDHPDYKNSRIVQECHTRLGMLYSRIEEKERALHFLSRAIENDVISNRTQWVALQTAGVAFEILIREKRDQRKYVAPERWEEVRKLCDDVKYFKDVTTSSLCRAELMYLETFRWEERNEELVSSATLFIEKYQDNSRFELEVDTAKYFLAVGLLEVKDFPKSIEILNYLVEKYKDKDTMWAGIDHLERCHYYLFENYRRSGAPQNMLKHEIERLKKRNPNSIWFPYMK